MQEEIVPCVLVSTLIFKLKKKVLLTYLVKVLTFGQTVDFFDQNVDFLDLCKNERGYGSKLEQKMHEGQKWK